MRFSTWITLTTATLCALTATGCGNDYEEDLTDAFWDAVVSDVTEPSKPASTEAGRKMCIHAVAALTRPDGRIPDECDVALADDCADFMGLFADTYVTAIDDCLEGGSLPALCVYEATLDLTPSKAHYELASNYCNECAFGAEGCEDIFYFGDKDQLGLGMVALPFNEDVVREIADECTESLTCLADLPDCAKDILLQHAVPEKTVLCMLNPLND